MDPDCAGSDGPHIRFAWAKPILQEDSMCLTSEPQVVLRPMLLYRCLASHPFLENVGAARFRHFQRSFGLVVGDEEVNVIAVEPDQAGEMREFVLILEQL